MMSEDVKSKDVGEDTPPLHPLYLYMECCATQDEMNDNVLKTIERGYKPINGLLEKYSGRICIVGSGPTLEQTKDDLEGDIMAINHSLKYLLEHDIVPKFAMIWDADPICEQFAIPNPEITYLIGARCHPSVFKRLEGCNVIVWHAGGDHNILDILLKHEIEEPMINGGSAGVTRAMYLAVALGYRELHIYGGDSCYLNDKTHVNGSLVPEKDLMVSIGQDEPLFFRTTPEWCAQVNEFRDIYSVFAHPLYRIKVEVHGQSMLYEMWERMREKDKKGLLWKEDGTPHPSNPPVDYTRPLEELKNDAISN